MAPRKGKTDNTADTNSAHDVLSDDVAWLEAQKNKKSGAMAAPPDVDTSVESEMPTEEPPPPAKAKANRSSTAAPAANADAYGQVFLNETPTWTMYWDLPMIRSFEQTDTGVFGTTYKDLSCRINQYENDEYTRTELAQTARRLFESLHMIMDAVRRHTHLVQPDGGVDYLPLMDSATHQLLESYRRFVLNKRLGYPRITLEARYGFPLPNTTVRVKIVLHEHTDPLDVFLGVLEQLEIALAVESDNARIEDEYRALTDDSSNTSVSGGPPTNPQQPAANPAPVQGNDRGRNRFNPIDIKEKIECWGDEQAQNAPFDTMLIYHATRIYRAPKDGKWNFYMPVGDVMKLALEGKESFENIKGSKGIYAYETGAAASKVIEAALADGRLPDLQTGEGTRWLVDVVAVKLATKTGNARYEIIDLKKVNEG